MQGASQSIHALTHILIALTCANVRIQVAFGIIPLFNRQTVPGLLRAGIGVSLSVMMVPSVLHSMAGATPTVTAMVFVVTKEAFLGLVLGYAVATLFWGIEAVGFFIDNQRGASIASTLNPLTGNDSSPLGIMFNQAFAVYFLVSGGFQVMMSMLYASYSLWPVMSFGLHLTPDGMTIFANLFESIVKLSLTLSAPAIVGMLLGELALGLVSRFVPQLQVFFLAMPVKCGLAFFMLLVSLPTLFGQVRTHIEGLSGLLDMLGKAVQ